MTLKDALIDTHDDVTDRGTLDALTIYLRDERCEHGWQETTLDELDQYTKTNRHLHLRAYSPDYVYTTPLTDDGTWQVVGVERTHTYWRYHHIHDS